MKTRIALALGLTSSAALFAALPSFAEEVKPPSTPSEFVAAAKADEWVAIAPSDLLVMNLAPDAKGKARRVVIQLMPAPFSQGWVGNIKKLAAAHWWDGTSVNRVQDNYVVQWGDATEKKELPKDLAVVPESEYLAEIGHGEFSADLLVWPLSELDGAKNECRETTKASEFSSAPEYDEEIRLCDERANRLYLHADTYSTANIFHHGWPVAADQQWAWPIHCYGMVGVGRNLSPDTGTGAELYTVIGHAPRHLDRNIAVVGRVIEGIENLSSLPRGTGALGFYENEDERVPITSIRLASELEPNADLKFEYLSTESESFAGYAFARANRKDDFFIRAAGGADICNIPVPVRRYKD